MNESDFSREKSVPAGSNLYYCILFHSEKKKSLLYDLFALANQFKKIIETCSDPGVARIKLHWWHEEIQRIFKNEARHPLGKLLEHLKDTFKIEESIFHLLINYEEKKLAGYSINSDNDLNNLIKQGPGIFWEMIADCIGFRHKDTPVFVNDSGCLAEKYYLIQNVRHDVINGRILLPKEYMDKAGVLPHHLIDKDTNDTRLYFSLIIKQLMDELEFTYKSFPVNDRREHLYSIILNQIIHRHCQAVREDNYNLLSHRISLTPLHKLWIAWWTKVKN